MTKKTITMCVFLATLALLAVVTAQAGPAAQQPETQNGVGPQAALRQVQADAPGAAFTYQGQLKSDAEPVTGNCNMAFRLYDDVAAGSQVGSGITTTVPITDGLFTVSLDFGSDAFDGDARWLGIRVNCPGDSSYADLGRQALTAVPYALYAAKSGGPENIVTVAKSGGDYTSVQAAINSIGDATASNPYLVWVAPGVYSETVTLKPYVHLQGAGQEATVITSTVGNETWPFTGGTLALAAHTSLRDLTLGNSGAYSYSIALLAMDGTTQTLVAGVTVRAQGSSTGGNYAVYLTGSDTGVTLLDVTALVENGSANYGLYSAEGAATTLRGGSYTARGGSDNRTIYNSGANTRLEAEGVVVLAEGDGQNYGLFNYYAKVTLRGGSFVARGGNSAQGISNNGSNAELVAESIVVLSENSDNNYGLYNIQGAVATVHGGSFTARGGSNAWGIYNSGSDAELSAESVTALGEDSNHNYGLLNSYSARAVLRGGSFTALGGSDARGISNDNSSSVLEAENVIALGEGGSANYGLHNDNSATATLHGGSFTARGGNSTRGIYTHDSGTGLKAERVTILGEGGATSNRGLESSVGAAASVTQSVLEGADSSVITTGGGGPVTLSNSRLVGGMAGGNVNCTAVSRGATFNANGCP